MGPKLLNMFLQLFYTVILIFILKKALQSVLILNIVQICVFCSYYFIITCKINYMEIDRYILNRYRNNYR